MDADALSDARRAEWERLDELSRARLDGAGVDELIVRYRAASADLAELKNNVELATRLDDAVATPTFVVNGQLLKGAVGYDALKQAVDAAREAGPRA